VWPPGLSDTVCPRLPLMTQVQHFVSRIKKRQTWDVQMMWAYDLDLWPWRSWLLSVLRILILCQIPSANFGDTTTIHFRFIGRWTNTAQTDHVNLTFDLEGHGTCGWCGLSSSIRIPICTIRKIWCMVCVSINGPSDPDLTVWPWNWYLSHI